MTVIYNWQFEFQNFQMGVGTNFNIESIEGLNPPSSRVNIEERAEDHGAFVYSGFMDHREITLSGYMYDYTPNSFNSNVDAWRFAFKPIVKEKELTFIMGDGIPRMVYAVPSKREFPMDVDFSRGYMKWVVQFICGDPRIYSSAEHSASFAPALPAGGADFPLDLPLTYGGMLSPPGTGLVDNVGVFPAPWRAVLQGPAINPRIANVTTGEYTDLNITLSSSDTLVVNSSSKTVIVNGTSSRYDVLPEANRWWEVQPGQQNIRLFASGTAPNNFTFYWRDAWI